MGERLQEAMSECFEKKSLIKFEHVDIGHELEKRGMLEMWPTEVSEHYLLRLNTFVSFCKRGLAPVARSGQTRGHNKKSGGSKDNNMCSYAWISGSARLDKHGMFMKRGTHHIVQGGSRRCVAKPKSLGRTALRAATQASCDWICVNGNWHGADT